MLPFIGRSLYSRLILQSKVRRSLPALSCHLSNLGSAEFIHPKGASLRLQELWPATISTAFLLGALSLNGKQFLTVIHQNDEISPESVDRFLRTLDAQVHTLMATAAPARDKVHESAPQLAPHPQACPT